MERLLEVGDLAVAFEALGGEVRVVDGVSFHLSRGETLGVVGESGSGKSVTAQSIMRLIPSPPGRIVNGTIRFLARNLLEISEAEMRQIRGNDITMMFHEPMTALHPAFPVGRQVAEVIELHQGLGRRQAFARAVEMLDRVGIADPERRARQYPHELSGGMRQRVMIAMAVACDPLLLIADEPTTALDVTIQAQILELMKQLRERVGTSILLITHDMGVVADMCDRVVVMYAGRVVEEAGVVDLFRCPLHPYTEGLLKSVPKLDRPRGRKLHVIEGTVPPAGRKPPGCSFHPRCSYATEMCVKQEPPLSSVQPGRRTACWHWEKLLGGTPGEVV